MLLIVDVEWEDRLDDWELELELSARLEGSDWVTLDRAVADTGASRAALRSWYRNGRHIPAVDGPPGRRTGAAAWSPPAPRPRPGCAALRNGGWPTRPSWRSSGIG